MAATTLTAPTFRGMRSRTRDATLLRGAGIATLLASAAFHIPVIAPHLHEAPYIGVLFIALTVACVALAVALAMRDSAPTWATAAAVTALAVIAYILSRTVGLPEIGDDIGNWTEPLGVASITAETLTVILAVAALALAPRRRARRWRPGRR